MPKPRLIWSSLGCLDSLGVRGPVLMSAQGFAENTAEVAFLSGMPRSQKEEQEDTRLLFKLDGRIAREVANIEKKMHEHIAAVMQERTDRPAKDYEENERDLKDMLFQAMKLGASGGYHEAPKQGPDAWTKWLVTVCGMLAVAGVGSAIGMYGKLAAIEANQINQQKQIDYLIQIVVRRTP